MGGRRGERKRMRERKVKKKKREWRRGEREGQRRKMGLTNKLLEASLAYSLNILPQTIEFFIKPFIARSLVLLPTLVREGSGSTN